EAVAVGVDDTQRLRLDPESDDSTTAIEDQRSATVEMNSARPGPKEILRGLFDGAAIRESAIAIAARRPVVWVSLKRQRIAGDDECDPVDHAKIVIAGVGVDFQGASIRAIVLQGLVEV